ncbi:hypothetical protein [Campylobacter jejuni]|uniref:hypothetical protein n=3 Tax=Campylobacter jejuni TaxID=197 RepID=UPI00119E1236|nr:hypothetical protein [Campylobacter jejuni]
MNDKINSSICSSVAKNTIKANVEENFFSNFDELNFNPNYQNFEAQLSSLTLKENLECNFKNENIKIIDTKEIPNINLEQLSIDLVEIFNQYKQVREETDITAIQQKVGEKINAISITLETFQNLSQDLFQNEKLDETYLYTPNTSYLFKKGRKELDELLEKIEKTQTKANALMNNESNVHILTLTSLSLYYSHSLVITHLAKYFIKKQALFFVVRLFFISNPILALILILDLICEIVKYFVLEQSKSKLKVQIYKLFCIIDEILQSVSKQNSPLAAIVNFDAKYYGNKISFKLGDTIFQKYLTTPNSNTTDKALMYSFAINAKQTQDNIALQNQRLNPSVEFAFSEFPLFSKDTKIKNSDIINSSAFDHLKNITTQFSNFLFIQTPYFTSTLTLDFLLQSLANDKVILCISNIVESQNIHFQIQNHIRDTLIEKSNSEARKTILFLNLIQNIDKKIFFKNFKTQIEQNFKALEDKYKETNFIWLYSSPYQAIRKKLDNLEKIFYTDDLIKIANYTYDLNKSVFEQERYFDQEDMKEHIIKIIQAFLDFDFMLCNFLDFKLAKKDDNSIDEDDLEDLRNRLREKLNEAKLSPNIYCIAHIFNNALFALNPNKELKYFKAFFENSLKDGNFLDYKNSIIKYLNKTELREAAEFVLPLQESSLWLNFFSYEHQNDLCIFLIYLFDLDLKGAFIKILKDLYPFKEIAEQAKDIKGDREKLRSIIENTFKDQINKQIIEMIVSKIDDSRPFRLKTLYSPLKDSLKEFHKNISNSLNDNKYLYSKQLTQELEVRISKQTIPSNSHEDRLEFYKKLLQYEHLTIDKVCSPYIPSLDMDKMRGIGAKIHKLGPEIVAFLITDYIETKLPSLKEEELERAITLFALGMRQKRDTTYAKWCKNNFFLPKNLSKSFIIADFKHSLLMDNALNSLYCTYNPSIAAYVKNDDLAQRQFKECIKQNSIIYSSGKYYDENYFTFYQDSEATHGYSETYYKIYAYIDLIKDEEYNFNALNNSTLMKQKMQDGKIKDFYPNKDFVISLKKVAEYNYNFYKGDTKLKKKSNIFHLNKDDNFKERLLNNFIYNEDFIPTDIDI